MPKPQVTGEDMLSSLLRGVAFFILLPCAFALGMVVLGAEPLLKLLGLDGGQVSILVVLCSLVIASLIPALLLTLWAQKRNRTQKRQLLLILESLGKFQEGSFPAGVSVTDRGLSGTVALQLNETLDAAVEPIQKQAQHDNTQKGIMELLVSLSALQEGRLNSPLPERDDLSGAVAKHINHLTATVRELLEGLHQQGKTLLAETEQVRKDTNTLLETTLSQTKETVSLTSQTKKTIREIDLLNQLTESTIKDFRNKKKDQAERLAEARAILESLDKPEEEAASKEFMTGFQEDILEMAHITQALDDYADRTSILALNTSIQSAMTEAPGLAEVATEIQSLADSSAQSAKDLARLNEALKAEVLELLQGLSENRVDQARCQRFMVSAGDLLESASTISGKAIEMGEAVEISLSGHRETCRGIAEKMEEVAAMLRESALVDNKTLLAMERVDQLLAELPNPDTPLTK